MWLEFSKGRNERVSSEVHIFSQVLLERMEENAVLVRDKPASFRARSAKTKAEITGDDKKGVIVGL